MTSTFTYRAWLPSGAVTRNALRADTREQALRIITEQGLTPISVDELRAGMRLETFFRRRPKQRVPFFRTLATMLAAGMPMRAICLTLVQQAEDDYAQTPHWMFWKRRSSQRFLTMLHGIATDIASGLTISQAMEQRPYEFSEVEVTMVAAGEQSGHQATVLSQLAKYLEDDYELSSNITAAMVYPMLVSGMGVVTGSIFAFFVAPRFADIFTQIHQPVPLPMRIILAVSHLNAVAILGVVLTIVAILYAIARYVQTPDGASVADRVRLRTPVFGLLTRLRLLVTITRSLAMLLRAGNVTAHALGLLIGITGSPTYARIITTAKAKLEDGIVDSFPAAIQDEPRLDAIFKAYVRVGEQTASLPDMLDHLASYYEKQANLLIASLPKLMEFALIVGLGVVVGCIALPIITSIFSFYTTIATYH